VGKCFVGLADDRLTRLLVALSSTLAICGVLGLGFGKCREIGGNIAVALAGNSVLVHFVRC
jgi:hypothetical protein